MSFDNRINYILYHLIIHFKRTLKVALLKPEIFNKNKGSNDEKDTLIEILNNKTNFLKKFNNVNKTDLIEFEIEQIPKMFSIKERIKLLLCAILHQTNHNIGSDEKTIKIRKYFNDLNMKENTKQKYFGKKYIHEIEPFSKDLTENLDSFSNHFEILNILINIALEYFESYYDKVNNTLSYEFLQDQVEKIVNYNIDIKFIDLCKEFGAKLQTKIVIISIFQNLFLDNQ